MMPDLHMNRQEDGDVTKESNTSKVTSMICFPSSVDPSAYIRLYSIFSAKTSKMLCISEFSIMLAREL
jgi:hypothetical protein